METNSLETIILFDSSRKEDFDSWRTVNDTVMGGVSNSEMRIERENFVLFKGKVSLENNGGFCATKLDCQCSDISQKAIISLLLKGDGKQYQFRVKQFRSEQHAFTSTFTTGTDWEVIKIPVAELTPFYRGRQLDLPNYSGGNLEEITFLIGNKVAETFELHIDKIWIEF